MKIILFTREIVKLLSNFIAILGPSYLYLQTGNGRMFWLYLLSFIYVFIVHNHYETLAKKDLYLDIALSLDDEARERFLNTLMYIEHEEETE